MQSMYKNVCIQIWIKGLVTWPCLRYFIKECRFLKDFQHVKNWLRISAVLRRFHAILHNSLKVICTNLQRWICQNDIKLTSCASIRRQIDVAYEFVQAFVRFLYTIVQVLTSPCNSLRTLKNSYAFLVKNSYKHL